MRRALLVLVSTAAVSLIVPACKPSGAPAQIVWKDHVGSLEAGGASVILPPDDLYADKSADVQRDEDGKRFAYETIAGGVRYVYLANGRLYLGARKLAPVDFAHQPPFEKALGEIFDAWMPAIEGDEEQGLGPLMPQALAQAAGEADRPHWKAAYAKLGKDGKDAMGRELVASLPDARGLALETAVTYAPLQGQTEVLAKRLASHEAPLLASDVPHEERAAAVMLRAVAAADRARGEALACEVLGRGPKDELLREAAALAVAHAPDVKTCRNVDAVLGKDFCLPSFRCGASGPLGGRETTKQDEALCDAKQLDAAVTAELARTPADVLSGSSAARPELFAYAALRNAGRVPADFTRAHERRLFALTQPEKPACDAVALGAACHCDEAILRDQACRNTDSASISVGLCKFAVDDKAKKISGVVATHAP